MVLLFLSSPAPLLFFVYDSEKNTDAVVLRPRIWMLAQLLSNSVAVNKSLSSLNLKTLIYNSYSTGFL